MQYLILKCEVSKHYIWWLLPLSLQHVCLFPCVLGMFGCYLVFSLGILEL